MTQVDLAIVGGGIAGLTAGMYAAQLGIDAIVIDRGGAMGQLATIAEVTNFPGIPDAVPGAHLGASLLNQTTSAGARFIVADANRLDRFGNEWRVCTSSADFWAKAVIVATGCDSAPLNVTGEQRLHGYGVTYCGSCDRYFFANANIAVIGGGDSALDETIDLANVARSIALIERRDRLTGAVATQTKVQSLTNVTIMTGREVSAILGGARVEGVRVRNLVSDAVEDIPVSGVAIYVGLVPRTALIEDYVDLDTDGLVDCRLDMSTKTPGLFVAGDIRARSSRRLIGSAADGASAAISAANYLRPQI